MIKNRSKETWYTRQIYVDQDTGKLLTEKQSKKYIITKKTKQYDKEYGYKNNKQFTIGIVTITNECTKNGAQTRIWE